MEKNTEVLNDLIKVNNDRLTGYEKAAKETDDKDVDLRSLFQDLADESRTYAEELEKNVAERGYSPAEGTTIYGDIYRIWMDMKATFTGKDRQTILASCEFGEDAAQRAYEKALKVQGLSAAVLQIINDQKTRLKKSHDQIKRMRDTQPA
jgi:uncharacterized protein (TIGR02284 family)